MNYEININLPLVEEANNSLKEEFTNMLTTLDNILQAYNNLLNDSEWETETKEYFRPIIKNFKENINIINTKFNDINTYLTNVVDNYNRHEKNVAEDIKNLGG